jgi:hypothetical protein
VDSSAHFTGDEGDEVGMEAGFEFSETIEA